MERKVIDFHTHAFPEKIAGKTISYLSEKGGIPAYTDGTVQDLKKSLTDAGVSLGVVLPVVTRAEQFPSITRFAQQINEDESADAAGEAAEAKKDKQARLLSFGGIHPDTPDYKKELKVLSDAGFLGIKLHPDYQGVDFDDIRYLRIMEYATELGMIVVTHAGVDVGFPDMIRCTPKRIRRVLSEVQPEKLVLAHMGGWGLWDEVTETLAGERVYLDTAYSMGHISQEQFVTLCRAHGTDKILFATDCPWGNPKKDIETFLSMPLNKEEQERILYRNGEALLGITLS